SGFTTQVAFMDSSSAGSLCADVTGHGAGECSTTASGPPTVTQLASNPTHYAQLAGSTATYQIIGAGGDALPESSVATSCTGSGGTLVGTCSVGQVKVSVHSTLFGNTCVCGNFNSVTGTITFSWTAQSSTAGPACSTTDVQYKTGTTHSGNDDFSNASNDIIADNIYDGTPNASAGIG